MKGVSDSPPSAGPPPRLQHDRYRLVERLGGGSMGVIYKARDETLARDVAIKFLLPERVGGAEGSARFLREARAVARLSHPHIMTLYDVGREGAWHYLVLEYIPGQDLHSLMLTRGEPLPLREAIQVMRGVLSALAYAHELNIVHRDIKPENVMVTSAGQVKVADFGLAMARGEARLTQEGAIVGTALYLAPELVTGTEADRRTDLYAIGAILYELLTGQPPFVGDDLMTIVSRIVTAPLVAPRTLAPGIPPAIEQIILKLLARDPNNRYASADEVLAALPVEADIEPAAPGAAAAERASLTLLERIVRSSSTALKRQRPAAPPDPDDQPLIALTQTAGAAQAQLTQALLVYAALEDTTAAVEAERRRLASLLQGQVVEPLNLLLSQASLYEQTLGANPTARMAVSVLTTLARQVIQQVRDLEANLRPTILETLGLEPALEALASQSTRVHGLQIILALERMRERLPAPVEQALFRATQDALDRTIRHAQASQVTIRLERRDERLVFTYSDNGFAPTGDDLLRPALQRLTQLGGAVKSGFNPQGNFEMTISFALDKPVDLTPRELETLQLLSEGLSNKEIARALSVSPRTVNFHLDNIYSKLGVSSRTEAAIYALRHGWVRRP